MGEGVENGGSKKKESLFWITTDFQLRLTKEQRR